MMSKSLDEVMAALPLDRQDKIRTRGAALVADEMTLRELRKAMGTTQEQLAARMGKPQAAISRMEAQSDMLMSTLGQVVEGMGGRLSIVAEMPGRAPVRLAGLGDLWPTSGQPRKLTAAGKAASPRAKAARTGRSV